MYILPIYYINTEQLTYHLYAQVVHYIEMDNSPSSIYPRILIKVVNTHTRTCQSQSFLQAKLSEFKSKCKHYSSVILKVTIIIEYLFRCLTALQLSFLLHLKQNAIRQHETFRIPFYAVFQVLTFIIFIYSNFFA